MGFHFITKHQWVFALFVSVTLAQTKLHAQEPQLRTTLTGHTNSVYAVAFSADGKTLASASMDKTVMIWDLSKGKAIRTLEHSDGVGAVALSPDGKTVVSRAREINIWNVDTGIMKSSLEGWGQIAFSPDGKSLAGVGQGDVVKIWNLASGEETKSFPGHASSVVSLALSRDGRFIAAGSAFGIVKAWQVESGRQVFGENLGPKKVARGLAFSPDGKTLATASETQGIKSPFGALTKVSIPGTGGPTTDVKLWDLNTGKLLTAFPLNGATSVAFSPDGKTLAAGSKSIATGKTRKYRPIEMWDVASGQSVGTLAEHTHWVWSIAFSPDGKTLASGSWDKTIKLWDIPQGK